MFRRLLALLCAAVLAGCAHTPPILELRVSTAGLDAPRAAAVEAYGDLADRVQAVASYYDRQVRVNHGKLRAMSVFSALSAAAGATLMIPAIHPDMPNDGRRVLGVFGVTLGANAVVFGLVPHAHQYFLKEVGYQRQAAATRAAYRDVGARCGPTVLADPATPAATLDACVEGLRKALDAAYRFGPDSPCKPPTDPDLSRLLEAGRDARP